MQPIELQAKLEAAFLEGQKAYVLGICRRPSRWDALAVIISEASISEVKQIFSSWLNGYKQANLQQGELSGLLSQVITSVPVPSTLPVSSPASEFQRALHDINNLLVIMSTYTALAVNKTPVDSPARAHIRLAKAAVGQAALFAHELQTGLK